MSEYTVGTVARLSGTSVRTLHHYDAIGLVRPTGRSAAGYRLYSPADLARLRRILLYRELDFSLEAIGRMLDGTGDQLEDHLRRQHRLLREREARTTALLAALEHEMEARDMGIALTPEEQLEVFGTTRFGDEYAQEAQERWGDTAAWKQSQRRAAAYTKADWERIKAEGDAVTAAFTEALAAGEPAAGDRATAAAELHRAHIGRWFYDCGHAMHRNLADLFAADERFYAEEEAAHPGLRAFLADAIRANAARAGA